MTFFVVYGMVTFWGVLDLLAVKKFDAGVMRDVAHIVVFLLLAIWGAVELQFAKTFSVGVASAILFFVGVIGLLVSIVIWLVLMMHIPAALLRYF